MILNVISLSAGDPWTAPNGSVTLHPQLHHNLDDPTPYFMHNGATHIATEVSREF